MINFKYKKCKNLREAGQSPLDNILRLNIFLSIAYLKSSMGPCYPPFVALIRIK
jgi:hypothetical protein